ncbi:MAG TPA: hypothetical protein VNV15_06330 [Opitutaceae bacterium]|jgi:hypothetical protein|nr:hypothetical protein [Opitutaceae bacterium]
MKKPKYRMKRFELIVRAKWSFDGATTIPEMIAAMENRIAYLRQLDAAGTTLQGPVTDDYAFLYTDNPSVAKKFKFWERET